MQAFQLTAQLVSYCATRIEGKHSLKSRDELDTPECGLTQLQTQPRYFVQPVCTTCHQEHGVASIPQTASTRQNYPHQYKCRTTSSKQQRHSLCVYHYLCGGGSTLSLPCIDDEAHPSDRSACRRIQCDSANKIRAHITK